MRLLAVFALLAGLAAAVGLVLWQGAADVWHAAAQLGPAGLAALLLLRATTVAGMGRAWSLLARGRADAAPWRFIWGRLLRDGAGDTLPLSQLGGYVIGARAATLAGVEGRFAAASTLVDLTTEALGQFAYMLAGLALLAWLRPGTAFAGPVAALLLAIIAALLIAIRLLPSETNPGTTRFQRLAQRLIGRWLPAGQGASPDRIVLGLFARRARIALAATLHFGCWLLSGIDAWLTLHLMGIACTVPQALVIDSLMFGLRTLAFLVPNALGVQEGGFVLFGALFGIPAEAALALSLIRRVRDLMLNAPALLAWQALEARAAWRRRQLENGPPAGGPPVTQPAVQSAGRNS